MNFSITTLGSSPQPLTLLISNIFISWVLLFHSRLLFLLHLLFLWLIRLCNLEIGLLLFFNWYHRYRFLCYCSLLFDFFGFWAYFSFANLFARISMKVWSIPLLLISFWISIYQPLHIFIITCYCLYVIKYRRLCLYS